MDFHGPDFILAIIAMSTAGWIVTSWIRAKHGYPLEGEWGGKVSKDDPKAARQIELLSNENEQLTGKVTRLEDRIAVLERIVTDKPARLSAEIDGLR
jgi:hypothetical protein